MSETATTTELAALFGITTRAVRDLAASGVIPRAGRGRHPMPAAVTAYISHLRQVAAGRGGDGSGALTAERARQAREAADNLALKNAALRRDLVPAAEVEARLTGVFRKVRAGLLAVPARAAQRLAHMTAADVAVIDREVRAALTELGDAD
jgi:phage terminase Nu1 subunit (DNA packaging protein)